MNSSGHDNEDEFDMEAEDLEDMDQDEDYFPFDDEPDQYSVANLLAASTASAASSSSSSPHQPSSNLPLSSTLISTLNHNAMFNLQAAQNQHHPQMTPYQFQVMQQQIQNSELFMLSQAGENSSLNNPSGLNVLSGVAGAAGIHLGPSPLQLGGLPSQMLMGASFPPGTVPPGFSVVHSSAGSAQTAMFARAQGSWDPSHSKDWDAQKPSDLCLGRIARDLHGLYIDPIPGIMVHANENDVTRMLALIKGPEGTPYEGGFFQFFLRCPPDYPISNPRVRLLTTGSGQVRFNPNLYANGKVCLSLLGTWSGPQWSPALNISSLLLSIQSLMCDFPYRNEPGFEKVSNTNAEVVKYNHVIRHETLRVAVIDMVKEALAAEPECVVPSNLKGAGDQPKPGLPSSFRNMILRGFLANYDQYLRFCEKDKISAANGSLMMNFGGDRRGAFKWDDLVTAITELKSRVEFEVDAMDKKVAKNGIDDGDGDSEKLE